MSPQRIQRKRTKGWRMPEGAVYVGRPTRWGNPFVIADAVECGFTAADDATGRAFVVRVFRDWLTGGPDSPWWYQAGENRHADLRAGITALRGRDLACWCPLEDESGARVPCHADILLELANPGEVFPWSK